METDFDFEKLRDRCVNEFFKLKEKPTHTFLLHPGKSIRHYAPGMSELQVSQWDGVQRQILKQVDFAATFIFSKNIAYGGIDIHRPLMVIKFGDEIYWRAVPKRDTRACIEAAKARSLYVKLRTLPFPIRTEIKNVTVGSYIQRVQRKAKNPPMECLKHSVQLIYPKDDTIISFEYAWDQSATPLRILIQELFNENVKLLEYYLTFPHIQPNVNDSWIVIDHEEKSSLYIEYRSKKNVYIQKVPSYLIAGMRQYAKNQAKLFKAPTHLRLLSENVTHLPPQ